MTDLRTDPKWKQTRYEDKVLWLLGAILDALKTQAVPTAPAIPAAPAPAHPPSEPRRRREKAD